MFTGIVTGLGIVREIRPAGAGQDMRMVIAIPRDNAAWADAAAIAIGASIACSGCCLTAVAVTAESFSVDVSAETLSKTTLGTWRVGSRVNLERPLRVGDELGGHIVAGHVDGVGEVLGAEPVEGSVRWSFRVAPTLARFIAPKGSVAIDGVSLTVNEVRGPDFAVNIIPHTAAVTSFGLLRPGDPVNIEIDTVARYVARLAEFP
ncbi:MAG: riboflavin synthase [Rhodospirillales bacterium]|nr:riboflavin synthase [Rhodospirillales bacterium]MDE2200290.1 riboflavin synthase [Rhodospirillales bacterium]